MRLLLACAAAADALLPSDDGTSVNGAILASDGGWSALQGAAPNESGRRREIPPSSAIPTRVAQGHSGVLFSADVSPCGVCLWNVQVPGPRGGRV